MESSAAVTPERIMQFTWGYAPPLVLEAAIKHRLFDTLDSGPKTIAQVAQATGTSERGMRAITYALAGMGLLTRIDGDCFSLTPESAAFLVSTKPSFMGGIVRHCSEDLIPRWLRLNEVVATGKPAVAVNEQEPGEEFFANFVSDLFPISYAPARSLAQHLQLGSDGDVSVLDLAAGSGVWGIALAQSAPQVKVTAVDFPGVLGITERTVQRFGLRDRYRFVAGDLNQVDFGSAYAVATLGHILHSEGPERSRKLLRKTFEALAAGGTIAIAEFLVNEDRSGPVGSLLFAVNMLVNTEDGDTYSFEQIAGWLREAGFEDPRLLEGPGASPLVLATKPRSSHAS